jgi:NADPH2:quinone reductase
MKAVRVHPFGGPDVLKIEEVPDPIAGPGQVVVRIEAIGINPVETYFRSGKFGITEVPGRMLRRRTNLSTRTGAGMVHAAERSRAILDCHRFHRGRAGSATGREHV